MSGSGKYTATPSDQARAINLCEVVPTDAKAALAESVIKAGSAWGLATKGVCCFAEGRL